MARWLVALVFGFLFSFAALAADETMVAYVSAPKAFMWSQPGYSWLDCRPLESDHPGNEYASEQDRLRTELRFKSGAESACKSRDRERDLLSATDRVEILRDKNGSLKSVVKEINIRGELMDKRFYLVSSEKGRIGWMSEDQITTPGPLEEERPEIPEENKSCPAKSKLANPPKTLCSDLSKIQEATEKSIVMGPTKSDQEIDRYMCLYRDSRVGDSAFPRIYKKFQKAAKQAAKAFQIPYGILMCTMLIESGLYYDHTDKDEYQGYSQAGSAPIIDLKKKISKETKKDKNGKSSTIGEEPYIHMWEKYARATGAQFSNAAIRKSSDPTAAVGFTGAFYQWLFLERMKESGCKNCSLDDGINRKELYLAMAGFNWGPYMLSKISDKSAARMRNSFPPPKESRDYMVRMENCLEKGYDASFRDDYDDKRPRFRKLPKPSRPVVAQDAKRDISSAKGEKNAAASVAKPAGPKLNSEQSVAQKRVKQCDQLYPVK